jgi:hypothetical protein
MRCLDNFSILKESLSDSRGARSAGTIHGIMHDVANGDEHGELAGGSLRPLPPLLGMIRARLSSSARRSLNLIPYTVVRFM